MGERLTNDQLLALCADTWEEVPPRSVWLHNKSGGVYEAQGVALASDDLTPVVIYINVQRNGPSFTRPTAEFLDGRFERLGPKEQSDG